MVAMIITVLTLAWPWYLSLLAAVFIAGGIVILYLTAHRNYKRNLEAWRLYGRAQKPATLDPGSVYTVDGVLSTRTADGGWVEIGSGVATFHFKPDRQTIALPPRDYKLTEWRRQMMERDKKQTPPTG